MEDKLHDIILQVCDTLNNNHVEYLITGGAAVALHGYFRMSIESSGNIANKYDIDIWYNPAYSNYFNLLNSLKNLGEDVSDFEAEQTPNPAKSFFKLEYEEFTLDFLPSIGSSLKFFDSFNSSEQLNVNGVDIPVINIEDLIANKEQQGRPKDIEDVEQLKKLRNSSNSNI